MHDGDHQHDAIAAGHGVTDGADRDDGARDDERAPPADSVGDRAGQRRRKRRSVGEKAEKESRRERRSSQLADAKRRRRQQLKRRKKYGKREAAHYEESQ